MNKDFFIKNKKKIIIGIIVLAISLIGISLINSTYSLFYHEDTASNTDAYSTGLLSIIASSKGENISLSNALPMSDSEGEATTPYTFTIKNIGNLDYEFNVKLLSTGDSSTTIDSRYIKVKVDDGSPATLSSLTSSIIKSDVTLAAGESIDISIRVWLSSDTPNTQIGKVFNSKIVTDGQAVYTSSNNKPTAAAQIVSLYRNAIKTPVINNNITYQYDTTNNLMQDVGGNLRYYGATPNNYIYFNCDDYSNQTSSTCEVWRIIGVFEGKVKIMRGSQIGTYSWDNKNASTGAETAYGKNDWSTARLMKLLNPSDYYEVDSNDNGNGQSLYWNSQSGTCFAGQNNATKACDFTSTGIKNDTTRNMISESMWYLRGYNSNSVYSDQIYEYERTKGSVYNSTRPTSWKGKIALAYPSDYGYAADLDKCQGLTLGNYNDSTENYQCRSNDWMYSILTNKGNTWGWLLTPYLGFACSAWGVRSSGNVGNGGNTYNAYGVAPVLYLGSELEIKAGDGSSSTPYQLSA